MEAGLNDVLYRYNSWLRNFHEQPFNSAADAECASAPDNQNKTNRIEWFIIVADLYPGSRRQFLACSHTASISVKHLSNSCTILPAFLVNREQIIKSMPGSRNDSDMQFERHGKYAAVLVSFQTACGNQTLGFEDGAGYSEPVRPVTVFWLKLNPVWTGSVQGAVFIG